MTKWNTFLGKNVTNSNSKEDNKNNTKLLEEVKNIVSRELSVASTKNTMLDYLDAMQTQGVKTETLIKELKTEIENSVSIMQETAVADSDNKEKIDEIRLSVQKITYCCEKIEDSVHKDNLRSYKNIQTMLINMDENFANRNKFLKAGIIINTLFTTVVLALVIYLVL